MSVVRACGVRRPAHATAHRAPRQVRAHSLDSSSMHEAFEKTLSGDVLQMFHDAQRNILELNKSRLLALDELKQARERIYELEQMCAAYERGEPVNKQLYQIRIGYATGWKDVYIHYKRANGTWTEQPGLKMYPGHGRFEGMYIADLDQDAAEFVFNNGHGDWDSPSNGANYVVEDTGEYQVINGTVNVLQ